MRSGKPHSDFCVIACADSIKEEDWGIYCFYLVEVANADYGLTKREKEDT